MKIQEVFAYLHVHDADAAIAFYTQAFGASEKSRLTEPSGKVGHAELDFGGTTVMISDEYPDYGIRGPKAYGGSSVSIHLHVDDADAMIARAKAAGGTVEQEPQDQFYGERSGTIRDPFGHRWNIGHEIEAVSMDEAQKRYTAMMEEEAS